MNIQTTTREIKILPVDVLKFDPDNPRIPKDINGSDDEKVIDYLLTEANLDDLMKSLLSQGYFEGEPLLVCRSEDGNYIVVEGNRRLGALKLINGFPPPRKQGTVNSIIEESNIKEINEVPCIVFDAREQILSYLGYRHITGIKEWDHLAKARYLDQLYNKTIKEAEFENSPPKEIYRVLAKNIGSKSNVVENLLRGLRVISYADEANILQEIGINPNDIHFSLLTTSLNNFNIRDYVSLNTDEPLNESDFNREHIKNLLLWLYGGKEQRRVISESRDITKLAKILGNEDSLKYMINHQNETNVIETAFTLSGGLLEGFENELLNINKAISSLSELVPLVSDSLTSNHLEGLDTIQKKAKSIYGSVKEFVVNEE